MSIRRSCCLLLVVFVLFPKILLAVQDEATHSINNEELVLWPAGLPSDAKTISPDQIAALKEQESKDQGRYFRYVDSPTLTVYAPPAEKANGCAVVICPGGGYNVLAWQHEGTELAEWFNSIGVTAFILKYRVPRRDPERIHWEPMQDVQRAIRVVRSGADKFAIDPARIGVMGFSAGGHLTVMAGTQFDTPCYEPIDDADDASARPDFMCPIYAAYLGDGYQDDAANLSELVTVTTETPPTFMAVTWDDRFRGAQSALLLSRLKENNVEAELHVFAKGGHGYGIRPSENPVSQWHHLLEQWLATSGFLNENSDR
ncbi:MAG: alpha/beta hydrolase [Pirellulaceae bacterium]